MIMNTLIGKTMAIWMLAGRPLAAIIFFCAGYLPNYFRNVRRIYREKRRRQTILIDETPYKPVGKYRLHD